ncbi:MAG: RidA family protein [Bacteroidetes bacterium]|nr:RidA family protein [Bacteroidota bacterium]
MSKKIINASNAPAPIGPYNQAVEVNGMLFISGQIALIPGTDELQLSSIEAETTQVMENLKAILTEAQLDFSNVIKTSIFLSDMNLFATVNTLYAAYFSTDFPYPKHLYVNDYLSLYIKA